MTIDWENLKEKPDKKYKITGIELLTLKNETENQKISLSELKNTRNELTAKIASLKKDLTNLESESRNQISENESIIAKLKEEMAEKASRAENELKSLRSQVEEHLGEIKAKENIIREKDAKIEESNAKIAESNAKIAELNAKIEELKEKIPKKPVYETAEEVIKGPGCPKCGWTTLEEYKIVDGQKQLIRKYCPNTFCAWTSTEAPKVAIAMGDEIPEEVEKELKIFKVVGADKIEEVTTLDSTLVAIIADPLQETVWIWKGKDSSRFDYAEATRHATQVKNDVVKKSTAPIKRINEGEEPENFPKL